MDEIDTFVASDELGKIRVDTGVHDTGLHIWVKELRPLPQGTYDTRTASIELTYEQAILLHAWLDLYLYPDMPNPCPDGLDECK